MQEYTHKHTRLPNTRTHTHTHTHTHPHTPNKVSLWMDPLTDSSVETDSFLAICIMYAPLKNWFSMNGVKRSERQMSVVSSTSVFIFVSKTNTVNGQLYWLNGRKLVDVNWWCNASRQCGGSSDTHTHTHAHKLTHSCSHAQVNTLTHTQKMILLETEYWHSISVFIKGLKKQWWKAYVKSFSL